MPSSPPPVPPSVPSAQRRPRWRAWLLGIALAGMAAVVCGALVVVCALLLAIPKLPPLDVLTDYRPKVPLRVYTRDHVLIGEFGEERRNPVRISDIPPHLIAAVLAIEDARFYEHGGVDFVGILRAGAADLRNGHAKQGASTITMQLARNFFLSNEKTYTRKLYEMLLAYRIEAELGKDQILEVYMNQIYLGQHAYGFASAARVYFGKELKDLTLGEAAMLAGLPKAPSAYNPVVNPKRAKARQEHILRRMLELGAITPDMFDAALREPLDVRGGGREFRVHAEYVAEMVRQAMYAHYRDDAYTRGFSVVTTVDSADQNVAWRALRRGLIDFEQRHGYRGPEGFVALPDDPAQRAYAIDDALLDHPDNGELVAAVVTSASPQALDAVLSDGSAVTVGAPGLRIARAALDPRAQPPRRIEAGSIVRLTREPGGNWRVVQLPQVEGAFVSMVPQDGAIRALVGGFDFQRNKFNHATQAWRQPGSSFKPFVYSASLERGLAPATVIDDAPLYFPPPSPNAPAWTPHNYGGTYDGPMTMRSALAKSKNLVSIRILNHIGTPFAQQHIERFGFDAQRHPPYLPMALGAGQVTPLQMAGAYSVFANEGYRVAPYLIAEVTDQRGTVVARARPLVAGRDAPRAIDARNAYIVHSLLQSVAQHGTAAKSNTLGRTDLAGKTGTTNESRDAWFAGYQHTLAAVAWIGYDTPKSLGDRETGGGLALPVWIDYMANALGNVPEYAMPEPEGVVVIDGELYYDTFAPGRGFVAAVGMRQTADGAAAPPSRPDAQPAAPRSPTPQERDDIMRMFQSA